MPLKFNDYKFSRDSFKKEYIFFTVAYIKTKKAEYLSVVKTVFLKLNEGIGTPYIILIYNLIGKNSFLALTL